MVEPVDNHFTKNVGCVWLESRLGWNGSILVFFGMERFYFVIGKKNVVTLFFI
jgi:hypothetical protein